MAHETDGLHSTSSISFTDRWTKAIGSWFRAQHRKYVRTLEIRQLLSCDERLLEDVGLSRSELVGELGYDPREMPSLFGAGAYRIPHL